ncbi:MAG: hypothetical protein ACYDA8_17665, partial [Deferrisomatales bacterium]
MMGLPPLFTSVVWGSLCGAWFGAFRTREAALHLLAKNEALALGNLPALPGAGFLGELSSWAPAAAGAGFYGLSLGLGAGTLLGLWAAGTRRLPGRAGRFAPWAALAAP